MDTEWDLTDSQPRQFMRLFLANQRRIYGLILTLVPNFADADDLLQEASCLMWQKFDQFQPGTDFGAWGLQFARFLVANHRRRRNSTGEVGFSDELVHRLAEQAPEALDLMEERRESLRHCLRRLPEGARRIVELRYQPGSTVKGVAATMGRSVEAVYKALGRAHLDLQRCVRERMRTRGWA